MDHQSIGKNERMYIAWLAYGIKHSKTGDKEALSKHEILTEALEKIDMDEYIKLFHKYKDHTEDQFISEYKQYLSGRKGENGRKAG